MNDLLAVWSDAFPQLLRGLGVSLRIFGLALLFGLPGGLLLALLQQSRSRLVTTLTIGFVELGRGAPVIVVLYLSYFGLAQVGFITTATFAAVTGLAFSTAAYTSEMFRAALQSVPQGQVEAAMAIGLSRRDRLRYVVLPQAIRIALPPVMGFAIVLFQGTSLCFVIAVPEMLSRAYNYASMTFRFLPVLTLAGLIYMTLSILAAMALERVERRLSRAYH